MEFTIPRQVQFAAKEFAAIDGIVDGDIRLTFAEVGEQVLDVAGAFVAAGLQPGERVAVWAPNMAEWVLGAMGALSAGAILVPLNTRYKGMEAADILQRSKATILLTVSGFLGNDYVTMLNASGAELPDLRTTIVLRGDAPTGTIAWADFVATSTPKHRATAERRIAAQSPDDVSDILFTAGTTGRSKGVMTTHEQAIRVFDAWSSIVGVEAGDRYLVVNPFFHSFGYKAGIIACFVSGATIVPEPVFDVPTVLAHIEAEQITVLPGAPTVYFSILNHPDRDNYDLSSLRLAVTGAAAVPVELIKRMREELTFRTIVTAYGLSESTGTVSICRPDDPPEIISKTSGRAIPGVDVKIVDDDGNEVPRGEPGEIICKGYNVMVGYLDDPEATAETIVDGWLHTGDIGTMDDDGYIAITDRKKDMFITGGFNAYPAEIENILLRHPAIAQVAVIGMADERMGEVGRAFVVVRPGESLTAEQLIAWARDNMANYKVPRKVDIVDSLPTNPAGKIVKFELRDRA